MKYYNVVKKYGTRTLAGAGLMVPALSFAQGSGDPYSSIVTAANWTQVGVDIVVIFAALAAIFVIFKGGKILLKAIGGR